MIIIVVDVDRNQIYDTFISLKACLFWIRYLNRFITRNREVMEIFTRYVCLFVNLFDPEDLANLYHINIILQI